MVSSRPRAALPRPAAPVWIALAALFVVVLGGCGGETTRREAQPAASLDFEASAAAAREAYEARDWRTAERHYAVLAKEIPQEAEYWFRLGNIYARTGRPDLAVRAYRETLVRDADFAKAWFNMGIVQLRQAANSFLKMEIHVAEDDPMRVQAGRAYRSILEILDEEPAGTAAAPAADAVTTEAADGVPADAETDAGTRSSGSAEPAAVTNDDLSPRVEEQVPDGAEADEDAGADENGTYVDPAEKAGDEDSKQQD